MLSVTEYLLIKVQEEAAELSQRAAKALRFGLQEKQPGQELTNAQRLNDELVDLLVSLAMLDEPGILRFSQPTFAEASQRKARVEKYMQYSRELGILERENKDVPPPA